MTETIKRAFDLIDTTGEIAGWYTLLMATIFEFKGFDDTATVAMFLLAALLIGYIRKLKAGPFEAEAGDEN